MNKILTLIVILSATFLSAVAQDNDFSKFADMSDIDVVIMSQPMLEGMSSKEGNKIGDITQDMSSMYVLTARSKESSKKLKNEIDKIIKKRDYQQTMFSKKSTSITRMYTRTFKTKGQEFVEQLIIKESDDSFKVVRTVGGEPINVKVNRLKK